MKKWGLLLFSLSVSFFFVLAYMGNVPTSWIDEPERVALGLALQNHLIFGREFVSDLGPLGFLSTHSAEGTSPYYLVLFDLFVVANLTFILFTFFSRAELNISIRLLLASLLIFHINVSLLLIWILLFMQFEYLQSKRVVFLIDMIVIVVLSIFIRFGFGLMALFFMTLFLFFTGVWRDLSRAQLIFTFFSITALVSVLAFVLPLDFFGYVSTSTSWLLNYDSAMHQKISDRAVASDLFLGAACLVSIITTAFILRKQIYAHRFTGYLMAVVFLFCFLLFKITFTKTDSAIFFDFAVPAALLLTVFSEIEREKIFYYTLLPIILFSFVATFGHENVTDRTLNVLSQGTRLPVYMSTLPQVDAKRSANEKLVSPDVLSELSGKSVDFMPGNLDLARKGTFFYQPRPSPQSYYTYTKDLDQLNAGFLESRGPDVIVFKPISFDRRYPLFDDPQSKIQLLSRYRSKMISPDGDGIILERLPEPIPYSSELVSETLYSFSDIIDLEQFPGIQIGQVRFEYSWLGQLYRFFFWSPDINLTITLFNNSTHVYRCVPSLLESGVIINKFVDLDNQAAADFFDYYGRLNSNVKSIQFTPDASWAYKNKVVLKIDVLNFSKEKKRVDRKFEPIRFTRKDKSVGSENIRLNFETITIDQSRVDCFGWAFVDEAGGDKLKVGLLFEGADHSLVFPLKHRYFRPDVRDQVSKNANDSSGFGFTIYREFLDSTRYGIGLAFFDETGIRRKLVTGNVVENAGVNLSAGRQFRPFTFGPADHEGSMTHAIERKDMDEDFFGIVGWAFLDQRKSKDVDSVRVILRSKDGKLWRGDPSMMSRRDVSDYFRNSLVENSGFEGVFFTHNLEKGMYDLGLYVMDKNAKRNTYAFLDKVSIGYPRFFSPQLVESPIVPGAIELGVDKIENADGLFTIAGWAFDTEDTTGQVEIEVLLKSSNEIYVVSSRLMPRPDVAEHFKKDYLVNCGFQTLISKRKLPLGRYEIGVRVRKEGAGPGKTIFSGEFVEKE